MKGALAPALAADELASVLARAAQILVGLSAVTVKLYAVLAERAQPA